MKTKRLIISAILSTCLLAGTVFAGFTTPMPSAPPPPVTAVKQAHVRRADRNTVPLTVFDVLSMVLSNLGILR